MTFRNFNKNAGIRYHQKQDRNPIFTFYYLCHECDYTLDLNKRSCLRVWVEMLFACRRRSRETGLRSLCITRSRLIGIGETTQFERLWRYEKRVYDTMTMWCRCIGWHVKYIESENAFLPAERITKRKQMMRTIIIAVFCLCSSEMFYGLCPTNTTRCIRAYITVTEKNVWANAWTDIDSIKCWADEMGSE